MKNSDKVCFTDLNDGSAVPLVYHVVISDRSMADTKGTVLSLLNEVKNPLFQKSKCYLALISEI